MKRKEIVSQTTTRLKQELIGLMLKKPFEKISVNELVEKANISRSTFYLHYSNIDELLRSMEDDLLEKIEKKGNLLTEAPVDQDNQFQDYFYEMNLSNCITLFNHKKEILVYLSNNGDPYFVRKLDKINYNIYYRFFLRIGVSFDEYTDNFIHAFSKMASDNLYNWLQYEDGSTIKERALYITNFKLYLVNLSQNYKRPPKMAYNNMQKNCYAKAVIE